MKFLKSTSAKIKTLLTGNAPTSIGSELLRQAQDLKYDDAPAWLESLLTWLSHDSATAGKYTRFKFLFQMLDAKPEWRDAVVKQIALLTKREGFLLKAFLETGYSDHEGLFQETMRRFGAHVLPRVRAHDLAEIAADVFQTQADLRWLEQMPDDLIEKCAVMFAAKGADFHAAAQGAATEALGVMLNHVADLGLTTEIRERTNIARPSESPFLKLDRQFAKCLEGQALKIDDQFSTSLVDADEAVIRVYDDMERNGTSVGLVYRLEVMTAALARVRLLMKIASVERAQLSADALMPLLSSAASGVVESQSIIGHFRQQTHLLSRKIAERNGASGDHYIARTSSDRRTLIWSALKGGAIVLFMTVLKLSLHSGPIHIPPLIDAILVWFIYTGGFILMQATDSTLATKLPSFTASRLAVLMNDVRHSSDLDLFVKEIKTVLVSQALAFAGNMASVIPLAIGLNYAFETIFAKHVIDQHLATETLHGLHPIFSFALVFGALTGVLLWFSSLAGGWFENWVVYRKLPRAIEENRKLRYLFGRSLPASLSKRLQKNASTFAANVTLGFLFGFVPFVGFITGLPLDSRHVTISSASAVLAAFTLNGEPNFAPMMTAAVIGLVIIGILNLTVSFALALIVAARASAVDPRRFRILLRMIRRRLIGF